MNPTYTDKLGNPIQPGDKIIYPTASGSSSAALLRAEVLEVEPLVPIGGYAQRGFCRASQEFDAYPTSYYVPNKSGSYSDPYVPDLEKAYVLRVQREGETRKLLVKNVTEVVVITGLLV
jgi:hypothetical protein